MNREIYDWSNSLFTLFIIFHSIRFFDSFAQFKCDLIVTRTQEGKRWHKVNDKNYCEGRPKRVLNDRSKHVLVLMKTHSMREVEKKTNISLSTLKRIKKQAKEEKLLAEN